MMDYTAVSDFLSILIKGESLKKGRKWLLKVKSTLWDILGIFGLNLTEDLSPSINALAINSLTVEESFQFRQILINLLKSKIAQGWLKAFETDVSTYNKVRDFLSLKCYVGPFPSTNYLLRQFSGDMYQHMYRPWSNLDSLDLEELLKIAFSDLTYLGDPLATPSETKKIFSRSKSLELSKSLLREMSKTSPHLLVKVLRNSQAFSHLK
jgi:hypothetical protein